MSKDEWVTEFVKALVLRYRKHLSPKMARTIAIGEYVTQGNVGPDAAARRWAAKAKD